MPVIPEDPDGVMTNWLSRVHFESRLIHLKGIGRRIIGFLRLCSMSSRAGCAGTLIAEILERIFTMVPVLPVDLDTCRLRNSNVLRLRGRSRDLCFVVHDFSPVLGTCAGNPRARF